MNPLYIVELKIDRLDEYPVRSLDLTPLFQSELLHRDKKLAHLNKELIEKASYASQLQEDFENAIYQLKRVGSRSDNPVQ